MLICFVGHTQAASLPWFRVSASPRLHAPPTIARLGQTGHVQLHGVVAADVASMKYLPRWPDTHAHRLVISVLRLAALSLPQWGPGRPVAMV